MLLSGAHSVPKIADFMHEQKGLTIPATKEFPERPINSGALYKQFSNLAYTGTFEWDGTLYGDIDNPSYPAMITMVEYDRAQEVLGRKGKPRRTKGDVQHNFTGLIECGHCKGCFVTCDPKRKKLANGKIVQYDYYKCTRKGKGCPGKQITKAELTKQMNEYVASYSVSPRLLDWIRDQLLFVAEKDREQQKKNIKQWLKKYEKCDEAIQNLIAMYTATDNLDESLFTKEEFKDQKQKLMKDRTHYKTLVDEHERNVDSAIERTIATFEFSATAKKAFTDGDADTQRMVLMTMGAKWILKDGEVLCDPRFAFKRIGEAISATTAKNARSETKKSGSVKRKKGLSESESILWQPVGESNPCFQDENLVS